MPIRITKINTRMKYTIEMAPLLDYYVVAVKNKVTGELKDVLALNESGAEILKLLSEGNDYKTVASILAEIYDVPSELVINDILMILEKLHSKGIILTDDYEDNQE